jgi:hypothetical protein
VVIVVITNCGYSGMLPVACVYCMSHDDGLMTETCCGSNSGSEEDLLS